jgi:hypothetical protein
MLADEIMKDGRQIQFLVLNGMLILSTLRAQMLFRLLAIYNARQMDGSLIRARMALHARFLR